MSSPFTNETLLTFTPEQFLTLIVIILGAIGGAIFWITYKIRGIEKDVENVLQNPYIKAFRDLEEKHARQRAEMFENWEEKKISEEEDTTNKK